MKLREKIYKGKDYPFNWHEFHAWKNCQNSHASPVPSVVPINEDVRIRFACEVQSGNHFVFPVA